jgi:hypothetical protein
MSSTLALVGRLWWLAVFGFWFEDANPPTAAQICSGSFRPYLTGQRPVTLPCWPPANGLSGMHSCVLVGAACIVRLMSVGQSSCRLIPPMYSGSWGTLSAAFPAVLHRTVNYIILGHPASQLSQLIWKERPPFLSRLLSTKSTSSLLQRSRRPHKPSPHFAHRLSLVT